MRWLGWLLLLSGFACSVAVLAATGILPVAPAEHGRDASATQSSASHEQVPAWRRTAQGWQRPTWLSRPVEYRRPALHPVVVGLLLTLSVLASMVLLSPEGRRGTEG
jgi:hypothetical protein